MYGSPLSTLGFKEKLMISGMGKTQIPSKPRKK